MNSIRVRLLRWLIGPILLLNLAGASLVYLLAWRSQGADTVRVLVLLEGLFTLVLAGLIWFAVTRGLQPLDGLRAGLDARDGDDMTALAAPDVPVELASVVNAFDNLLARLQAGNRSQHEFLANVAHQLRTPLAGLQLQLEWLAGRHRDDADSIRSLRLMLQSNERMIRQTNQLLALARAEPSRFEKARLEPLDLAALVAQSIQQFVDRAHARGIDLGFELDPAAITGDAFLLRDLIDNLVDNALRYTPAGGAVTVRCGAEQDGRHALLEVEDSGPGIPADERERVFSRFVRLAEHTTGSGLGLAIVRDIALAHGARVAVLGARSGQGALFQVRFPQKIVGVAQ
jgi:two-component system, OmpR family, sensor histidine kinase TctE